jgi:hypothetical protein
VSSNALKTPFAPTITAQALQRVTDVVQQMGKALPCRVISRKGQLVTVAFEVSGPFTLPQVTLPIATSKYDWAPLQAGDTGLAIPADVYLGGVSGLGGGTASHHRRANLATLQFVPTAKKDWTAPGGDANDKFRVITGPSGAIVQDLAGKTVIKVDGSTVTITVPSGHKVSVTAGGTLYPVETTNGPSPVRQADGYDAHLWSRQRRAR